MIRNQHRLIICLDGTWNNKDDSTNVLHHHALALDGEFSAPENGSKGTIVQKKQYFAGVGTGVLDRVSGGGFGFGLEQNVREAYDWLVENYGDGAPQDGAVPGVAPDELYIFGFSRGAYTARSLVGFIATYGVLRRGAPLTVSQLWKNYCVLGRQREQRKSLWDRIAGVPIGASKVPRRISDLVRDPWNVHAPAEPGEIVAGQLNVPRDQTETLLMQWSRRVKITYLGIYDTVGAMGFDALAIPGLTSSLALHHNMRPTSIIEKCRHALAIDEHRGNFKHTPFLAYIGHGGIADDEQSQTIKRESQLSDEAYWNRTARRWSEKIEQRWFAGAHSNIGGGYEDNDLAQLPLGWLIEGAADAGLVCQALPPPPPPLSKPKDSYSAFGGGVWSMIMRNKRNYRRIAPEPDLRASVTPGRAGYSLRAINEAVHDSVAPYLMAQIDTYRPPNLYEYDQRRVPQPGGVRFFEARPRHAWLGERITEYWVLVMWTLFAAVGVVAMMKLFFGPEQAAPSPFWLAAAALAWTLVDWGESRGNFSLALNRHAPRRQAFLDSVYWTRTVGLFLFVAGVMATLGYLFHLGWHVRADAAYSAATYATAIGDLRARFCNDGWWLLPAAAGVGVLLVNCVDRAAWPRHKAALLGWVAALVSLLLGCVLVVFLAWLLTMVLAPLGMTTTAGEAVSDSARAAFAGVLLSLQLGFIYFANAFKWVGEPLERINLGSMRLLQRCATPQRVSACLETWRSSLACQWGEADKNKADGPAARAMREAVNEALWRDIFGFIPVYTMLGVAGLWFAATELQWAWLGDATLGVPHWLLIPLIVAGADYCEDSCHLHYLSLHKRGEAPGVLLTLFAFGMSMAKLLLFFVTIGATGVALCCGVWQMTGFAPETGWRGAIVLLFAVIGTLLVLAAAALWVYGRVRKVSSRWAAACA
jgi:uncharacterized protein (DUF2235 family)